MRDRLPDIIDTASPRTMDREYVGALPITGMTRLVEAVRDTDVPELQVRLSVGRDAGGVLCVQGRVEGALHLTCQRCLERLDFPVLIDVRSALVRTEADAQRLAAGYDPLLLVDDRLVVRDLVEDELLLALPGFPQHPEGSCSAPNYREHGAGDAASEKSNPFAVLANLKRK